MLLLRSSKLVVPPSSHRTLRLVSLLLLVSCSGMAALVYLNFRHPCRTSFKSLFQRVFVQRLRRWIWRTVFEEDMQVRRNNHNNEAAAMAAATAVKGASSAAAQAACLNQVMLTIKAQENYQTRHVVSALKAVSLKFTEAELIMRGFVDKVDGTKELSAIQGMPLSWHSNGKRYNSQWEAPSSKTTCSFDTTACSTLEKPQLTKETNTFRSPSFLEVMAMLERGETPPGIKKINDKPPIPNQLPSVSCLKPKPKPWEMEHRASSTVTKLTRASE